MSKICDRNYKANQAYTVKMINGIGCCPLCEKPTALHGKTVQERALFWALSSDTGVSSEAIASHFAGADMGRRMGMMPPSDADDRGRCIRLLELIPEWLPRLDEMRRYDTPGERQDSFTISSSGITADHNTWAKQIPLMVAEGKL